MRSQVAYLHHLPTLQLRFVRETEFALTRALVRTEYTPAERAWFRAPLLDGSAK